MIYISDTDPIDEGKITIGTTSTPELLLIDKNTDVAKKCLPKMNELNRDLKREVGEDESLV